MTAGYYLTAQGFLELFDKKTYKYGNHKNSKYSYTILYFYICSVLLGKWGCITGRKSRKLCKKMINEKIRQFQYPCWNRYGSWQHRLRS